VFLAKRLPSPERVRARQGDSTEVLRQFSAVPVSVPICYLHPMRAKSDLKHLAAAVLAAERDFDAARGRSILNRDASLFDHVVCAGEEGLRDRQAEHLGSLEIDD
jgi:hypothetical protein